MARIPKLNWCPGSGNRKGRWRVRYKGKPYYFVAGWGKSDRQARKQAECDWAKKKLEIDSSTEADKPYREEYENVIAEWQSVLSWAQQHGDSETSDLAVAKVEALKARLASPKPVAVNDRDRFEPLAKLPYRFVDAQVLGDMPHDVRSRLVDYLLQNATWHERLRSVEAVEQSCTLQGQIDSYLELQDKRVANGQIGHSRRETFRSHLATLRDVIGGAFDLGQLSADTIARYFDALSNMVAEGALTQTTASDKWGTAKKFIRWLWSREAIESLPRNLDSPDFKFARRPREIETVSIADLQKVLARPTTDRSRLYVLLMLNCGFTQVDIANLTKAEIDFTVNTITRKRSKTRKQATVPTVTYQLWPETAHLLKEQLSEKKDLALVNAAGAPLRSETTVDRKFKKNDNIRSAWHRICKREKLKFSLTTFRKTSATLLRSQPQFSAIYDYFLGHAPTSVADRHYAAAPQELPHQGITWLREKLQIEQLMNEES